MTYLSIKHGGAIKRPNMATKVTENRHSWVRSRTQEWWSIFNNDPINCSMQPIEVCSSPLFGLQTMLPLVWLSWPANQGLSWL